MSNNHTDLEQPVNLKSIPVEVVELELLTLEEQHLRLHLERKVERAFYEAGKALMELRDRRLYRSTHRTFEEYCRERFEYNRSRSYQLIDAATVMGNLQECPQIVDIFPTKEGQVRPLTKLQPEQQQQAWQQAVEEAGGKAPSGRIVKGIVQRIIERTKVPNPYRVGEVCQFVVKDNPELRGKSGCWCIVTSVNNFSCTVNSSDGDYIVKMEHLKSLEYSDSDCEQLQLLCDRLSKLRNSSDLEQAAVSVLKHLGEVKRPYLTPLEEKLLGVLEQEYEAT
ncbi:MAG: hypothetical protein KME46_25990 [Brasilonema angustatum HA4187-MV1]|nr:hypothetical protein [Brasilonema angustatum HA4187-MV1]